MTSLIFSDLHCSPTRNLTAVVIPTTLQLFTKTPCQYFCLTTYENKLLNSLAFLLVELHQEFNVSAPSETHCNLGDKRQSLITISQVATLVTECQFQSSQVINASLGQVSGLAEIIIRVNGSEFLNFFLPSPKIKD